jgi:hypothetical protein
MAAKKDPAAALVFGRAGSEALEGKREKARGGETTAPLKGFYSAKEVYSAPAFFFWDLGSFSGRPTSSRMDAGAPSPTRTPRGMMRV